MKNRDKLRSNVESGTSIDQDQSPLYVVSGPIKKVQLKRGTWKHKIDPNRPEFGGQWELIRETTADPFYIAVDKTDPDRLQHVRLKWFDQNTGAASVSGPHMIVVTTEELTRDTWDVVTAWITRKLPRSDQSTGGFIYVKS